MGSCELQLFMICCIFVWNVFLYKGYLAMPSNVAIGKSTLQSSTLENDSYQFGSHLANDGNNQQDQPNTIGIQTICSHTTEPPLSNEWWVVDLGAIFDIFNINIYGRTLCCDDRFQDFDVDVIAPVRLTDNLTLYTYDLGQVNFREHIQFPVIYTEIYCPNNTRGQLVRLRHRGTRVLTICEVEVYGQPSTCLKASDVSSHHGFPGHRYQAVAVETLFVNSAVQCMAVCKKVHCCYAANFNKKTRQCGMMTKLDYAGNDGLLVTDNDWNVVLLY